MTAATSAEGFLHGSVCIVLRGRVTLDVKVRHCSNAGAAAVIIVDTTGDAIGPDLDEVSRCIPRMPCAMMLACCSYAQYLKRLFPASTVVGCIRLASAGPDVIDQLRQSSR